MNTVAYDEKIRTVDLLRSPTMIVRLFYIEAGGNVYDQHATNARELVHVLGGKAGAKIGTIKEWIKALSDDKPFYEFMPTAPQVVQVCSKIRGREADNSLTSILFSVGRNASPVVCQRLGLESVRGSRDQILVFRGYEGQELYQ